MISSNFKTILTGSSFLGLRSSVFVLYPPLFEKEEKKVSCHMLSIFLLEPFKVG